MPPPQLAHRTAPRSWPARAGVEPAVGRVPGDGRVGLRAVRAVRARQQARRARHQGGGGRAEGAGARENKGAPGTRARTHATHPPSAIAQEGTLEVFDLGAAERVHVEVGAHDGPVWSLAALPDRSGFVSGSADKTVKFWQWSVSVPKAGAQGGAKALR